MEIQVHTAAAGVPAASQLVPTNQAGPLQIYAPGVPAQPQSVTPSAAPGGAIQFCPQPAASGGQFYPQPAASGEAIQFYPQPAASGRSLQAANQFVYFPYSALPTGFQLQYVQNVQNPGFVQTYQDQLLMGNPAPQQLIVNLNNTMAPEIHTQTQIDVAPDTAIIVAPEAGAQAVVAPDIETIVAPEAENQTLVVADIETIVAPEAENQTLVVAAPETQNQALVVAENAPVQAASKNRGSFKNHLIIGAITALATTLAHAFALPAVKNAFLPESQVRKTKNGKTGKQASLKVGGLKITF